MSEGKQKPRYRIEYINGKEVQKRYHNYIDYFNLSIYDFERKHNIKLVSWYSNTYQFITKL